MQFGRLAVCGQWLVVVAGDAVVAAGGDGHVLAVGVAGQLHEAHVEVAAGVEGDGGVLCGQAGGGVLRHDVLVQVLGVDAEFVAELAAGIDQVRIVFEAGQGLAVVGEAAAEVAFAGAPVEPVAGAVVEGEAAGEGFDLLPLAAGDVDAHAWGYVGQRGVGQWVDLAQGSGSLCEPGEGLGGVEVFGVVVGGFGLFEGAVAQPGG